MVKRKILLSERYGYDKDFVNDREEEDNNYEEEDEYDNSFIDDDPIENNVY